MQLNDLKRRICWAALFTYLDGAVMKLTLMGSLCMQAIFHGKPVVAMPYFGDQPSNADRMVAKVIPSQSLRQRLQSWCSRSGLRKLA